MWPVSDFLNENLLLLDRRPPTQITCVCCSQLIIPMYFHFKTILYSYWETRDIFPIYEIKFVKQWFYIVAKLFQQKCSLFYPNIGYPMIIYLSSIISSSSVSLLSTISSFFSSHHLLLASCFLRITIKKDTPTTSTNHLHLYWLDSGSRVVELVDKC